MLNKKDIVFFYTKAKLEDDVFETYIGFLWWILDPVLSASVYYVIFHVVLHNGREDYLPYLFIGIVAWKWFQSSVIAGSTSIVSQKSLFKKIFLPKIIFPWIELNVTTVKFAVALAVVVVVFPLLGFPVTRYHAYLPVLVFCQFAFTLGIATLLAAITPFFPDFSRVLTHLLRLAFYPSGIIFSIDRVPEKWKFLIVYNPMARAVEGYRNVAMYGKAPAMLGLALLLGAGAFFYFAGAAILRKNEGTYAKLL